MLIADLPDKSAQTYEDKLEMARSIAGMSYLGEHILDNKSNTGLIKAPAGIDTVGSHLDYRC
jgi:hypothetical protein